MPPQNKTPGASLGDLPNSQTFWRREMEDSGERDVFGLHREKRPAPLPPDVSKNNEILDKDRAEESTLSSQEETNPFISPGVRTARHGKGPAPAKPSLKQKDALEENVPKPKNRTIGHDQNLSGHVLFPDETSLTSDSCLDQQIQSGHKLDNLLISGEPVSKRDSNTEVTKKKSQAPLPPGKLTVTDNQNSTSQLDKQDQDKTLSINSGLSTSVSRSPTLISTSTASQAHASGNKTLPQARVSPIDAQPVPGQIHGGEPKKTSDPVVKPCR